MSTLPWAREEPFEKCAARFCVTQLRARAQCINPSNRQEHSVTFGKNSRSFSKTAIGRQLRWRANYGGQMRTNGAPPDSKSLANWQTHFFSCAKRPRSKDLPEKLSLPTVANSTGKWQTHLWNSPESLGHDRGPHRQMIPALCDSNAGYTGGGSQRHSPPRGAWHTVNPGKGETMEATMPSRLTAEVYHGGPWPGLHSPPTRLAGGLPITP